MPTPNILFITCDQLRQDALGCYNNDIVQTPHIDRLAAEGVRFTESYVASPVCGPNRGSIATGRYPSINGLRTNGCILPPGELTLMEALRQRGYRTYGSGKMHFGPQWRWVNDNPDATWDFSPDWAVDPQPQPWEFPFYGFTDGAFSEDNRVGPYAEYLEAHGFDPWADPHSFSYPQHVTVQSAYPAEHHQTAWITDRALDFLNAHPHQNTDQPFFLWVSYVHPHHPFNPPAPYDNMYNPAAMPPPLWHPDVVENWPETYRRKYLAREGSHEAIGMVDLPDAEWQRIKAFYYGMISFIDDQIGRLLQALADHNRLQDTIIIFTSDHGEMLGDYHLVFKGTHYDCVTRVPLIIRRPDDADSGQSRDLFASSLDLMPTMLDLAGVSRPASVQGRSLVPALKDPAFKLRESVFIEDPVSRRTLRTPTARLTWHGPGQQGELYDLQNDPQCFNNLWNKPEAASLQTSMMDQLMAQLVANVDPLPPQVGLC